jgi:hypothetical protein
VILSIYRRPFLPFFFFALLDVEVVLSALVVVAVVAPVELDSLEFNLDEDELASPFFPPNASVRAAHSGGTLLGAGGRLG